MCASALLPSCRYERSARSKVSRAARTLSITGTKFTRAAAAQPRPADLRLPCGHGARSLPPRPVARRATRGSEITRYLHPTATSMSPGKSVPMQLQYLRLDDVPPHQPDGHRLALEPRRLAPHRSRQLAQHERPQRARVHATLGAEEIRLRPG